MIISSLIFLSTTPDFIKITLELLENLDKIKLDSPHEIPNWVKNYILDGELKEYEKEQKHLEKLGATQISIDKARENLSDFNF